MTFANTASAINGAELDGSLIRRATYAAVKTSGIANSDDLKVQQLSTPGVGIRIAAGSGVVLNGYQSSINEAYVVSNPSEHIVPSGSMPASNPSAKSYIVAAVIGDPDFSQVGHPFMLSTDPPAGTELTFEYVRVVLIEVSAGTTELSVPYPALVLARIDVPASTTTITNAMITDLRKLVLSRQEQRVFVSPEGAWTNASPVRIPAASDYANWGSSEFSPTVEVPSWATRAVVVASINGVRLQDTSVNVTGKIRAKIGSVVGTAVFFDYAIVSGGGALRDNIQCAGDFDVTSVAGTSQVLRVEGYENVPASPTTNQRLALQNGAQMILDVRFFEE